MLDLKFDKEKHEYSVDDIVYPSVTQILQYFRIIDTTWFTEESSHRGTIVHRAAELLDQNKLDWLSLDEQYIPYVKAYENFLSDSGFVVEESEKIYFNHENIFAGTIDRKGNLNGKKVIIDLKTGSHQHWWDLQLTGYRILSSSGKINTLSLRLLESGSYRLEEHKTSHLRDDFISLVRSYHLLNERGIK